MIEIMGYATGVLSPERSNNRVRLCMVGHA